MILLSNKFSGSSFIRLTKSPPFLFPRVTAVTPSDERDGLSTTFLTGQSFDVHSLHTARRPGMIKGLKDVIIGMKIGGKRRALIPPTMGYVNENLKPIPEEFGPRRSLLSHANEPLVFEVQLSKIL